jgi:hypothetical protein
VHPVWRARAVEVYRLWRDGGFVVDALIADAYGLIAAIWSVAALTAASAVAAPSWSLRSCSAVPG